MRLISCSEPVVCAVLGIQNFRESCGCGKKSMRITTSGKVLPCVYWNESRFDIKTLDKLNEHSFDYMRVIPEKCKSCKYVRSCCGGCEARRVYNNLYEPDEYCPFVRGEKLCIPYTMSDSKDLVHSSYLCTMIFGK